MKITDIEIKENNVKSAPDSLIADGERTARDIKNIFDKLPELIAQKHNSLVEYAQNQLCTKTELETAVIQEVAEIGGAKIARLIYDNDNDGMVDNSKLLEGHDSGYFATSEEGVHLYTHGSDGIAGNGVNGRFKATISETVSSMYVNGIMHTVKCADENEIELVEGNWYTFIIDGTVVNFKSGGGLTKAKLAIATADAADVLRGKTFYAGNKELKTGTAKLTCSDLSVSYSSTGIYYGSAVNVSNSKALLLVRPYAYADGHLAEAGSNCYIYIQASKDGIEFTNIYQKSGYRGYHGTLSLLTKDDLVEINTDERYSYYRLALQSVEDGNAFGFSFSGTLITL